MPEFTQEELLGTIRTLQLLVEQQRQHIEFSISQNRRLIEMAERLIGLPTGVDAIRFLAEIWQLDEPGFVDLIRAFLIIRDSDDVEAVRFAAKAVLRNQQRLEDKLDDAREAAATSKEVETL